MHKGIFGGIVLCALSLSIITACDMKKHAEDLGFKQGDGLVEKGVIKYDHLVDLDEDCNKAWADYQSTLQRRNDMIPQLVGVVRGAAAHEETTLIAVTQARANATRPEIQMSESRHIPDGCDPATNTPGTQDHCQVINDFEDPQKFQAFQQAQASLGTQMSRLLVANEAYPQVAALPAFHDLQVQIEGTENRINRARETFNNAVSDFNKELRHVSGKVINPLTGFEFKPRQYFQADQNANVAPTIDFGAGPGATAVQPAKPVPSR